MAKRIIIIKNCPQRIEDGRLMSSKWRVGSSIELSDSIADSLIKDGLAKYETCAMRQTETSTRGRPKKDV